MGIQSLGVGSGLALDDLVTQLLAAERQPREARINEREERLDATLSGIGQLRSRLSDFGDTVEDIRRNFSDSTRTATVRDPNGNTTEEEGNTAAITADVSNSATRGEFQIAVSQLASGSRIETAAASAGGFASSSDSVLSAGSGSLTFRIGDSGDSFSINVSAGTTLTQLRDLVNNNADNFGVNASIINTGTTDGGARLVFTSEATGAGNDLNIINDNDLADLQRVATTDSGETSTFLTPAQSAQNAIATIDGIEVQSSTNEFENTLANVSFEATRVSELDTTGTNFLTTTLNIGFDTEGFESNIRDFVDNFNSLSEEIDRLTRFGESDLEDDGALAGDFLPRNILNGLNSILTSAVESSEIRTLFELGVSIDDDGRLQISSFDEFGQGSGEDRLDEALENNFDAIVALFNDENDGIGTRIENFVSEFVRSGGLIPDREAALRDERDQIFDDRARLELQLLNSEQILRDRFLNLDLTVAQLNRTGSALAASLAALG